jgi:hypothetical protein
MRRMLDKIETCVSFFLRRNDAPTIQPGAKRRKNIKIRRAMGTKEE